LFQRAANRWAGITNGALLQKAAASGFEVLVSTDGSLERQQNLTNVGLAVIILRAASNRLQDTSPLMSQVLAMLPTLQPGQVVFVS
jgi:hypothetical protein